MIGVRAGFVSSGKLSLGPRQAPWSGLVGRALLAGFCLSGMLGCDSPELKACHAGMVASQKSLLELNKENRADVERVLGEVKVAHDACAAAKRDTEKKRVGEAVRQLENLLEALDERARRAPKRVLTEDETKALLQKGDSTCPKGEGYQLGTPPKMVRCTGKTMIEMNRTEVRALLEQDGYRILSAPTEAIVRAEQGSKVFVVEYQDPNGPPTCLRATPKPGVPWHETASRLTGVPQQRLKVDEATATARGRVMIHVRGGGIQETVLLGECG